MHRARRIREAGARKSNKGPPRRARESVEAIWIAIGWGYVTEAEAAEVLTLLDRVIAMLVRLRFPKQRMRDGRAESWRLASLQNAAQHRVPVREEEEFDRDSEALPKMSPGANELPHFLIQRIGDLMDLR